MVTEKFRSWIKRTERRTAKKEITAPLISEVEYQEIIGELNPAPRKQCEKFARELGITLRELFSIELYAKHTPSAPQVEIFKKADYQQYIRIQEEQEDRIESQSSVLPEANS